MSMSQWHTSLNVTVHPELLINGMLTWEELCAAMSGSDGFKAPGPSGVQLGFLKCAIDVADEDGVFPAIPTTPLGRIILAISQAMWVQGVIPEELCIALLVSIHKKGDKSDMSNYRGISLCETLLKIVSSALACRIQVALDNTPVLDQRLVKEQAGFRKQEESVSQYAALLETCQRRKLSNQQTILVFLDFQKAFDSVPHSLLMYKLFAQGIQGRALNFIQALYKSPSFSVTLPGGLRGTPTRICRGVRQGCPLSPILFDIFINNLLQQCQGLKVPPLKFTIAGLLFADDATLMAVSGSCMQQSLDTVSRWATAHHMTFNNTKCGSMEVTRAGSPEHPVRNPTTYVEYVAVSPLTLQGQLVPQADSYIYLGLPFVPSLDLQEVVAARKIKCLPLINASSKFFQNSSIPFMCKLDFLRGAVLPKLCFGGEIFGFNKGLVRPLEQLLTKCIRMTLCGWGAPCAPVLLHETGILSVANTCSIMRARAITKFSTVRTIISDLVKFPMSTKSRTWVSGSIRGLKSALKNTGTSPDSTPEDVCAALKKKLSTKAVGTQTGLVRYVECKFSLTKAFLSTFSKHFTRFCAIEQGVVGLVSCRGGNLFTSYNRARAGFIPDEFLSTCPCCMRKHQESINHLFLSCSKWATERASFLAPLLALLPAPLSRTDKVTCILGGTVNGFTLGEKWTNGTNALFLSVARFLAAIRPRRKECLLALQPAPSMSPGLSGMAPVIPGIGGGF